MTTTETATSPLHLMSLFAQRAAAGDVDGLLALYEPDAVFEPRIGTVLRGTEAIRAALTAFAGMRPRIDYSGEADCVIVGDIAMVANTWTMVGDRREGGTHREAGLSADVLRRQPDGSWLVLIDQPRGSVVPA